ncbi:MAG TPA: SPOR domain-containing protein [Woeseiaceae bacterium]
MGKRKGRSQSETAEYPGWLWMLFGLAIGLSVAFAIYMNGRNARVATRPPVVEPASMVDTTIEPASATPRQDGELQPPPQRFDFYDMLPSFEVIIPEQESDVSSDTTRQAVVNPGTYVLQAGSFTEYVDADRRRAQLALQGIESSIQRVVIADKAYHRVRIGPIDDLDELNVLRTRLRQADIDVLRIRLGD